MGRDKVPHSLIDDVLSNLDIVDVISSYIPLKPSGRNFVSLCPFHPEKTPSFVVSPEKQIFKCFGCGIGGNAITFIEKYENIPFYEALKKAAQLAGVELSKNFQENRELTEIQDAAFKSATFFHKKINKVSKYLENRGISEELASKFLIGYAPRGYSKEIGIKENLLRKLNLLNNTGKEFFSERLIIPIFNHSGNVIGFGARALKENQQPKYINSPESEIFKKSSTLFGFSQAKKEILRKREIIIVEGYFDVISLHGCGIENVVAPMGTSLTVEQARIAKRYADKIVLMFDGDEAGRKATLRASTIFCENGAEPFIASMPDGEDPDSLARKDPEDLKRRVELSIPLSEWLLKEAKKLPEENKTPFLKTAINIYSPIKEHDPFKFKKFTSKLIAEFGLEESWIRKNEIFKKTKDNFETLSPIPWHEKAFLKGLFSNMFPEEVDISPNVFMSDSCAKLYSVFRVTKEKDLRKIELEHPELSGIIAEIMMEEFSKEELESSFSKLVEKEIRRRLKRLGRDQFKSRKNLQELAIKVKLRKINSLEEIARSLTKLA